jgi:hypothetical protein
MARTTRTVNINIIRNFNENAALRFLKTYTV